MKPVDTRPVYPIVAGACRNAQQGCWNSAYDLGIWNLYGEYDLKPDIRAATLWLEYSTELGSAEAPFTLGLLATGAERMQKKDIPLAVSYLNCASRRGHVEALSILGDIYLSDHEHVTHDHQRAVAYYIEASDKGSARAARSLGFYYEFIAKERGHRKKALHHYTRAVLLGDPTPALQVARMHQYGDAGRVDQLLASLFYMIAAKNGCYVSAGSMAELYDPSNIQCHSAIKKDSAVSAFWDRESVRLKIENGIIDSEGTPLPRPKLPIYSYD